MFHLLPSFKCYAPPGRLRIALSLAEFRLGYLNDSHPGGQAHDIISASPEPLPAVANPRADGYRPRARAGQRCSCDEEQSTDQNHEGLNVQAPDDNIPDFAGQ